MSQPTRREHLLANLESRLKNLDQLRLEALQERNFRSVPDIAAAARLAARVEGERVVIYEVTLTCRQFTSPDAIDIEVLLWAALSGASQEPYTSNIDAAEYARGQRVGLTWVRQNIVPRLDYVY